MIFGRIVLWISIALFGLASSNEFPVTITSNVTLHDGIVCYNQSIELTCHADGINVTMFKWMSSDKSIQSEHSTNITVIATNSLVEYTCTVSDINGNHGYSSVDILSNASAPVLYPVNFNVEETVYMNRTINLTVQITNAGNLPLTSGPTWYRINADLPEDHHIENNFKDGNNYTTLIIDKASYANDGGTYCLNATNQFNTSTICVLIHIWKYVYCYRNYEPVPVLSKCKNHTTVEGEIIKFKCSFGDNYLPNDHYMKWKMKSENGSYIIINDRVNYTDFRMDTHQDCPSNNYSCCRFTSELSVHTNLSMNNATVSCNAILTSFSVCHLSVVVRPTIALPLTDISAEEGKTVNLDCSAIATAMSEWTMFSWLKNNDTIRSNPNKYSNNTEINPDKADRNFMKSILTIYDISKEDEADYTCIVYYDPIVLQRFGINDEFSSQTTAALQVEPSHDNWPLWEIATSSALGVVIAIVIAVVTLTFYIYRKTHGGGGDAPDTPGENRPLLQNTATAGSSASGSGHSGPTALGLQQEESDDDHVETDRPLPDTPKVVDMIILLLLVRTKNTKFPPSENDGWLEDISQLLEKIKPFVQLDDDEQKIICDKKLEPQHRSLLLYKMMKERNKINEVSTLLYDIYYANRDFHHSQVVTSHGSGNEVTSPPVQPAESVPSQEIHHHHYNLHINVAKVPNLEEFLPDTDNFANPLYQHATDFMDLVDVKTLSPVLIQNDLLTQRDIEYLQMATIIDTDKKDFIFVKLLRLGKEGYEKFMNCLKDPYAKEHTGHKELYHKLSSQQ